MFPSAIAVEMEISSATEYGAASSFLGKIIPISLEDCV
jgi:hypothetical protein